MWNIHLGCLDFKKYDAFFFFYQGLVEWDSRTLNSSLYI